MLQTQLQMPVQFVTLPGRQFILIQEKPTMFVQEQTQQQQQQQQQQHRQSNQQQQQQRVASQPQPKHNNEHTRSNLLNASTVSDKTVLTYLLVCNPLTKERMKVPLEYIWETRGVASHLAEVRASLQTRGKKFRDVHVCLLHQKGRCRSGKQCNQVHVDRAWLAGRSTAEASEAKPLTTESSGLSHRSSLTSSEESETSSSPNDSLVVVGALPSGVGDDDDDDTPPELLTEFDWI